MAEKISVMISEEDVDKRITSYENSVAALLG